MTSPRSNIDWAAVGAIAAVIGAVIAVIGIIERIDFTAVTVSIGIVLLVTIVWGVVHWWRQNPPTIFISYADEDKENLASLRERLDRFGRNRRIALRYRADSSDPTAWQAEAEGALERSRAAIVLFSRAYIDMSDPRDSVTQRECLLIHQQWSKGKLKVFPRMISPVREKDTPGWAQWLWSADIYPTGDMNYIGKNIKEVIRGAFLVRIISVALALILMIVSLFGALAWFRDGSEITLPSFGIFARNQHDVTLFLDKQRAAHAKVRLLGVGATSKEFSTDQEGHVRLTGLNPKQEKQRISIDIDDPKDYLPTIRTIDPGEGSHTRIELSRNDLRPVPASVPIPGGRLHRGARDSVRDEKGVWKEEESLTTRLLRRIYNQKIGIDAATRGGGPIIGAVDLEAAFDLIGTPPRRVPLDAFDIDEYEVTNKDYCEFLGLKKPKGTDPDDYCAFQDTPKNNEQKPSVWSAKLPNGIDAKQANQPVVGVSFYGADAYCRSQGKRLPTEDEWEAAARGGKGWPYPWGERFDEAFYRKNNGDGKGPRSVKDLLAPRENAPKGMATNAGEWTSTDHPDGGKVIKGSAWTQNDGEVYALAFVRHPGKSLDRGGIETGFRCARGAKGATPKGMIRIPGGEYGLGGDDSPMIKLIRRLREKYANAVEIVLREPRVTEPIDAFSMDGYEVTNRHYKAFLGHIEETKDRWMDHLDQPQGKDHKSDYLDKPQYKADNQPVVGVDWYDAHAFCRWVGRRLPTTEEWEYAARWNRENPYSLYPWGNEFDKDRDVFGESPLFWPVAVDAPPGEAAQVAHLAGNVQEWTSEIVETKNGEPYQRIKGGNWKESGLPKALVFDRPTSAAREYRGNETGFRCAADSDAKAGR
uniref:Formylglycine-generating enzyme, required for sulfatase activity, contains SUMF1/FGE domain n=1 Tax=Candidatus Kentrum eta TaxID=2126337 RepID=A0A450U7Z0_9GAMM|nr:MAG: Formylglycine-generating enzyme, required for sulfatase activity, contains SUMF1/FGE domain [Candidatus Kentron sp. H]VFJ89995.1 MAG: Formylglycine-generating enzyme, required for sulfatase activity, contains SUMF1/FGE domain [Candidatus Kentron sp. H]VFJ96375.1 MAG: Formylglycine-generating enzyme, required for sulfatase activity, contains SUMF1/FGE domain [Candidatus Kentron sp. H]